MDFSDGSSGSQGGAFEEVNITACGTLNRTYQLLITGDPYTNHTNAAYAEGDLFLNEVSFISLYPTSWNGLKYVYFGIDAEGSIVGPAITYAEIAGCDGVIGSATVVDCEGNCGGSAVEDCAGECNGSAVEDCAGDCNGSEVEDCAGECGGSAEEDCNGDCDGGAVEDECGECDGDGSSCVIEGVEDYDVTFWLDGQTLMMGSYAGAQVHGFQIQIDTMDGATNANSGLWDGAQISHNGEGTLIAFSFDGSYADLLAGGEGQALVNLTGSALNISSIANAVGSGGSNFTFTIA